MGEVKLVFQVKKSPKNLSFLATENSIHSWKGRNLEGKKFNSFLGKGRNPMHSWKGRNSINSWKGEKDGKERLRGGMSVKGKGWDDDLIDTHGTRPVSQSIQCK